jgi:hypothetical protein
MWRSAVQRESGFLLIILSWREMELPSNGQIDEAVKITLKELDLQDCQAVRNGVPSNIIAYVNFALKNYRQYKTE